MNAVKVNAFPTMCAQVVKPLNSACTCAWTVSVVKLKDNLQHASRRRRVAKSLATAERTDDDIE